MFREIIQLLRRCYALASPFGRRKLFGVLGVLLFNGIFQVVGVTSVFPFMALAAEPMRVRQSEIGKWILEQLPAMDHSTLLIWAGLFSILLLVIANAASLTSEVMRARYSFKLGHLLRTRIVECLSERPYAYFLEKNSGVVIQKLVGDVTIFINSVFLPLLDALSRVVTLALLLLTVLLVEPLLSCVAAILIGGSYGVIFFSLRRKSNRIGEGLKIANRGSVIAAQQLVGGIKPIRVHGKSSYFKNIFITHSDTQGRLYPQMLVYSNTPRYFIEPVAFGGLVLSVIWFAVQGKPLTAVLPTISIMALAGYRMLPAIQALYAQVTSITTMRYTVAEIEAELKEIGLNAQQSPRTSKADSERTLQFKKHIHLENIHFVYPNAKRPVLAGFNLKISKMSSTGIVGTTGSGKSTLVDIILGLHTPDRGNILVDGRPLLPGDLPGWRSIIGYVPQDIYLLDASVAENIAFGIPVENIDHDWLRAAASAAQILDFIETELPQGWKTTVGERGVRLSGGQRQRIGLARALYHQPEILILDEATSALDVETEAEVMKAIQSLKGKITMIIIAHRLSTIESCDQVCRLEGSKNTSFEEIHPH
jgi:ABC-type multidrug transport system fused ATPase/permease subunit